MNHIYWRGKNINHFISNQLLRVMNLELGLFGFLLLNPVCISLTITWLGVRAKIHGLESFSFFKLIIRHWNLSFLWHSTFHCHVLKSPLNCFPNPHHTWSNPHCRSLTSVRSVHCFLKTRKRKSLRSPHSACLCVSPLFKLLKQTVQTFCLWRTYHFLNY